MKFKGLLKWTGNKSKIAHEIVSHFPDKIDTYYEPFIGSAIVARTLFESGKNVGRIVCSDINDDLIDLYNCVKYNFDYFVNEFNIYCEEMSKYDVTGQEKYYYERRETFNNTTSSRGPLFFFLSKTCYAGIIRYNKKGKFNCPYGRKSIEFNKALNVLKDWYNVIQNFEFIHQDYRSIQPNSNDFCFFDPPYFGPKYEMYQGKIEYEDYIKFLNGLNCKWAMTLDGKSDIYDRTCDIPVDLYTERIYLSSQECQLSKMIGKKNNIQECFYIKL